MIPGTASPTPTDSPILSHTPLLTKNEIKVRPNKKSVEFKNIHDEDDILAENNELQKNLRNVQEGGGGGLKHRQKILGDRLLQPRMSLLGRPLNYRATRRDARYRRLQSKIYNFLERPRGVAFLYHIIVFVMVFTGLALSVFSTIEEYEKTAGDILVYMESLVCILFSVELGLRTWSSGCRSRYQGYIGRLKFLRRPFCVIDMITIVASIVVLVLTMKSGGQVLAASALRGLRFFQILRMVRMDRRGGTWKLLGSVVYAHRQELITTLYIGFLGLIFASFLVFLSEKDVPGTKFTNFAQALWWGVITLCTVGYGDMVPFTWQGKIIASFCSLLGISFFALPAGILGSGFALKVQQQQRQKHMIRRRQPAAMLIQSLWRCYAADEKSLSVATWKIHQVPYSPPIRMSSSFRHNASFVGRLSTIRRHKSTVSTTTNSPSSILGSTSSRSNVNTSYSEDSVTTTGIETRITVENQEEDDEEPQLLQLTAQHKGAIRAIRKLKYFVARKKFREALKPYDVKDVIEQYSSGHADLLNRVRNLQFRLDQILGKQGSKNKDVYSSKICLASRVVKVERQVDDVLGKLEQFFDVYMEDRKILYHIGDVHLEQNDVRCNNTSTPKTTAESNGLSSGSGVTVSLMPKSILIDKQLHEEPNPPILSHISSRRSMQKGYSDLRNRIRKKVTLFGCISSNSPGYSTNTREKNCSRRNPLNEGLTLLVPQDADLALQDDALELPLESTSMPNSPILISKPSVSQKCCGKLGTSASLDESSRFEVLSSQAAEVEEDDEEEEITETTLLFSPTVSNEIIITPSTLTNTSKSDRAVESIYMKNLATKNRYKES